MMSMQRNTELENVRTIVAALIQHYGEEEIRDFTRPYYVDMELAAIERATLLRDAQVAERWAEIHGCSIHLGPLHLMKMEDEWPPKKESK